MKTFVLRSLFILAMTGVVLAQSPLGQVPLNGGYVRLQPQALDFQYSPLSLDTNPVLAPNAAATSSTATNTTSTVGNPGGIPGILSVPNFTRSFTAYGQTYPYTIVGNDPGLGHTTTIPANMVGVSLQLLNPDGTTRTNVSIQPYSALILNSPNFEDYDYDAGHGQFADAVQRAEFYNVMKQNWHTQLKESGILDFVTVQVPATVNVTIGGKVFTVPTYFLDTAPTGDTVVLMLDVFFNETLFSTIVNQEINAGNFTMNGVNMVLLPNTFLFSINSSGVPSNCCVLGFHTYVFDPSSNPQPRWLTLFASWIPRGYFSGGFADVTSLSHEISETFNDPFMNNIVPAWQYPGLPSLCQNNLETGDPIESLFDPTYQVYVNVESNGYFYHPQNEALLQWFEQASTSDAYEGSYSYPYTSALTAPATSCQ
jgi:hypothetical protein